VGVGALTKHTGRVIALDLGDRRVGVALSSSDGRIALAHDVLDGADRAVLVRTVADLAAEVSARLVVVGVPYELSGAVGPRAQSATALITELEAVLDIPVHGVDERLSTVEVARRRKEQLVVRDSARRGGRGGRGQAGRGKRPIFDAEAAAVILERFLEAERQSDDG
jgi:putative holliday junction resolvase